MDVELGTNYGIKTPVRLAWSDLSVTLVPGRGPLRRVLDGLTGYAEPGGLTALMGPSGSGKSTLLDALAGRLATNAFVTGDILVNGRTSKLSFGAAAYVTQDDTLIGTLTVKEMIRYSARLRLPDKMGWSEREELVDSTILEMGLQDCADTVIGNWHRRGISGGEKRRVSIALEILNKPKLLFLDEPTSGLDSASAFFVVKTLRGLSRGGRTVIASLHQPSSEVFMLFDYLCLLSNGKNIYFGSATKANQFFSEAGFPCPSFRNPSDHFLRCVNSDFDKVKLISKESNLGLKLGGDEDDPLAASTAHEAIQRLTKYYSSSHYYHLVQEKVDRITQERGVVPALAGSEASFSMQACTLVQRSFVNMSRDFGYYWLRLAMYVALSICIGFTFLDVGTAYDSIQARAACSSFILGFLTFMSIGGFPSFVEDMKIFQRERMNGHYGVSAFVIGNTLSAMPFLILIALISGTICYFMVHLHPGFGQYVYFLLCLFASVAVVESLMMAIASIVPNFLMGIMIGASLQGFFMLVCGFFRLPNSIPKPVLKYPMTYISFLYWANQGQYKNDFKGLMFDNQNTNLPKISGESVLKSVFQVDVSRSKGLDLHVLFSMIIFYRLLFFAMIKIGEDVAPLVRGFLARRRLQENDRIKNMIDNKAKCQV